MKPGLDRAQRDTERPGDLAERQVEVVVQHEDRALLRRQSPETAIERVAVATLRVVSGIAGSSTDSIRTLADHRCARFASA